MNILTQDMLFDLMSERPGPCLSLYQRTHRHHPDNAQDPIRFGNLVKQLEQSLQDQPETTRNELLQPYYRLQDDADFWRHTLDGLVVLSAQGAAQVLHLHRPVNDFAVVADSWHVKPLFRIYQTADSFQVLCLTRDRMQLFEGNRDVLDEVDLIEGVPRTIEDALGHELTEPYQKVSSYGLGPAGSGGDMRHGHGGKADELEIDTERYFRAVDRAVLDHYSRPSALPLILVALPEYQGEFRKLSRNPFLLPDGVPMDPGALDPEKLRQRAWAVMEPAFSQRVRQLVESFQQALAKGLGSQELGDTLDAAAAGRVEQLLVDGDRHIPGRLDPDAAKVRLEDDFDDPATGDVLDDMVELVLRRGGAAQILPSSQMPTKSGVAAIWRY